MQMNQILGLEKIYNLISNEVLPISLAYKLSSLMYSYQNSLDFFHTQMDKLVDTYGERDENNNLINKGNSIQININALENVQSTLKQLENLNVHDPEFFLDENDLKILENFKLTPKDIYLLIPFIKEKPQT